jgi:SAM-dependent methyltransferase
MAKKVEDALRKGMSSVGRVVERAIGKAQEAKKSVVPKPGARMSNKKIVDSLETRLTVPKVRDVLRLAVERLVPTLLPTLTDRRALEVGESVGRFAPSMKEHGAGLVVATQIGAGDTGERVVDPVSRLYEIRAAIHRLPFLDNAFDFGVANLLTPYQGNILQALKELSRVMAAGGTLILTDFHPFGPYAKRGSVRVRPAESSFRGVADYYKAARLAGLRVADVFECFIDETVRSAFQTPEEKTIYRDFRDAPLVLCLVAKKGVSEAAA